MVPRNPPQVKAANSSPLVCRLAEDPAAPYSAPPPRSSDSGLTVSPLPGTRTEHSLSQTDPMDSASSDPRHRFHELVIRDVVRETADASSFLFDIPAPLEELFAYKPGQFFTLQIPWEDFEIRRCYSLSSAAVWGECPKVTVKRVEDGRMSNWLNDCLKAGDRIQVMPPAGHFFLHESDRPLAFFGAGSGITPILSIIKQALLETQREIRLVYANRDLDSVIFRDALNEMRSRFGDRFQLEHHLDEECGFLDRHRVEGHVAGQLNADFYICGPTPFMDLVEGTLQQSALDGGHIHIERFNSAVDPDRATLAPEAPSSGTVPDKVVITIDGDRHEIDYEEGETLLSAGLRVGLDLPFSCRDGYCSCCMAQLKRGEVQMRAREALSDREIDGGWILACQARPTTSECEIDYDCEE